MEKRNDYIDAVRGVAALFVIWGHTFFYIGMWFLPDWFKSFGLLFEVPVFFLLSGWAAGLRPLSVKKTLHSVFRLWLQWIFFITVLALACFFSRFTSLPLEGVSGPVDLIKNYAMIVSFPALPVVEGSVWFLPLFMLTSLFCVAVLKLMEKAGSGGKSKAVFLVILIIVTVLLSVLRAAGKNPVPQILQSVVFYGIFWMMGYLRKSIRIDSLFKCLGFAAAGLVGYMVTARLMGFRFFVVQDAKFPPVLPYACWACMSVAVVFYLEQKMKRFHPFLLHVGKNAIFYYFAQGVSTSLLCKVEGKLLTDHWVLKWALFVVLNILVAIPIAEMLRVVYQAWSGLLRRIRSADKDKPKINP
ncbi:MAG: acyltransferase [Lachnospiraceae bacterium]|nr:acyltransferase [Lachnospiraceae bacterium]